MRQGGATSELGLDWDAIRREADAAARDFLDNHWEAYLARVEKLEARPENQSGADKSWVERATAAHWENLRAIARAK